MGRQGGGAHLRRAGRMLTAFRMEKRGAAQHWQAAPAAGYVSVRLGSGLWFRGGENLRPDQGQRDGEGPGHHAQGHIVHGRCGQGQADEQGAQGVAGIAEHGLKGWPEALGNEHHQNIGEDEQGVENREEIRMREAGEHGVKVLCAQHDKRGEDEQGDTLLGRHKPEQVVGQAFFLFLHGLNAVIDAEQGENDQSAEAVPENMQDRGQVRDSDGLGKGRKLFERVAQQDEGQNFELFAHGFGERTGQSEDEADHFQDQDQSEGEVHGMEMIGRRVCGQNLGQHTLAVHFDDGHSPQEDQNQSKGESPVHALALPEMVQRIEKIGDTFKEGIHRMLPETMVLQSGESYKVFSGFRNVCLSSSPIWNQ